MDLTHLGMNSIRDCTQCKDKRTLSNPKQVMQVLRWHSSFLQGGKNKLSAWLSSLHSKYSRWGSYQVLVVASQWFWHRPVTIAILQLHENHGWRSPLVGIELLHQQKHSYRLQHYVFKMYLKWRLYRCSSIWWSVPKPSWRMQSQKLINTLPLHV